MTWVIGASTMFGYGTVISDICVTLPNGERRDILQKSYPVGKFIVAGFAGSVELGFMLLQNLTKFLRLPEGEENSAWYPDWVAEEWSPIAKKIYVHTPKELQQLGSEILMVGVSPNEDIEIPGFAKSYVSVLKSPDFFPEIIRGGNKIRSIGSGGGVDVYSNVLEDLTKDIYHPLMQIEFDSPGGWGKAIEIALSRVLENNPEPGISRHIQTFLVKRGEILQGNNDCDILHPNQEPIEIRMPPVVRGYTEFRRMVQDIRYIKGSIC